MAQKNLAPTPPTRPMPTLRLTFTYEGNAVRLASSQRVNMIVPPAVTAKPEAGHVGFWFEVHDSKGHALYHRVLHNPVQTDAKVFSNEPGEASVTRVPRKQVKGEFTLLVPELPGAQTLVVYGAPADEKARFTASRELVRYTFDELCRPPSQGPDRNQSH